jgi:hypothetical protein
LASLCSPKTRSHLVGFASFSQNQDPPRWLRFVLPKPGSTSLASLRSPKTRTCPRWLPFHKSRTYPPVALFRQKPDARAFGLVVSNDVKQPYSCRGAFAP